MYREITQTNGNGNGQAVLIPTLLWEKIFVIIGCIILADAFRGVIPFWNPMRQVFYVIILGVTVFNYKEVFLTLIRSPLVVALVAIAVVSVVWSADRGATISRNVALVFGILFAAYISTRYTVREQIHLLAWVSLIFMFGSLFFIFAMPADGLQGSLWRGVFLQKNGLGRFMALSALVALACPVDKSWVNYLKFFWYLTSLYMIYMADSMTALIMVVVVTVLFFCYRVLRLRPVPAAIFTFGGLIPIMLLLYGMATVDTDALLISLGRSPNLTGRAELWANLEVAIRDSPLTGYGYGAFFNKYDGKYGEFWSMRSQWRPGSGHHSYLDLWVELGIFALVVYIIGTVIAMAQALLFVRKAKGLEGLFPALYFSLLFALSFSESFILYNNLSWVLYTVMAFTLGNYFFGHRPVIAPLPQPEFIPEPVPQPVVLNPALRRTMMVRRVGNVESVGTD